MPARNWPSRAPRSIALMVAVVIAAAAGAWYLVAIASPAGPAVDEDLLIATAEQHLKAYGQYPENVSRVEVAAGEGEANHHWDNPNAPWTGEPAKQPCWIVTFYYEGVHPDEQRVVYIDRKTGEAIGGMQCK